MSVEQLLFSLIQATLAAGFVVIVNHFVKEKSWKSITFLLMVLLVINIIFTFQPKALFLNNKGKRLGKGSIGRIICECARQAKRYHITTHKLRHAFSLHMLRKGCDIRYIQEILGHEMLRTTTEYTEIYDADMKKKILQYHPRDHELYEKIDVDAIKSVCKKSG